MQFIILNSNESMLNRIIYAVSFKVRVIYLYFYHLLQFLVGIQLGIHLTDNLQVFY